MRAVLAQGLLFLRAFLHVQALGRNPLPEHAPRLKGVPHARVSMELQPDGLPGEQIVQFSASASELGGELLDVSGLGEASPKALPTPRHKIHSAASDVLNASGNTSSSADHTPEKRAQTNALNESLSLAMFEFALRHQPLRLNLKAYKLEKAETQQLLNSLDFLHWFVMVFVFVLLAVIRFHVRYAEPTRKWLPRSLCTWLVMAAFFLGWTCVDMGVSGAGDWMAGYIQELIFSLENIFIFYSVADSYGFPVSKTFNLLGAVVVCQVIYQGILFMGLAHILQAQQCLPFIIGTWLIFIGWSALMAVHGKHHSVEDDGHEGNISKDPPMLSCLRRTLNDRLVTEDTGSWCMPVTSNGRLGITVSTFVFLTLCIADFLMEIDVSFAKIEEFDNPYLGFTSSALAAFAVPELFLLARWLFDRFYALHYAIALILILFGVQLLIAPILEIPALVDCAIQIVVVLASIVISIMMPLPSSPLPSSSKTKSSEKADETTPSMEKFGAAGDMLAGLKHGD
mmetsp:Transcript_15744/g.28982  ORF Transcript_15744/g.28982 Transcript_15744/m.28982 type:complete len:512 (+) Transcript_15744:79-1614(+)